MSTPAVAFRVAVLCIFLVCSSHSSLAADPPVHTFDCKNCHIPSLSVSQLGEGNVCLSCHDQPMNMLLSDGQTGSTDAVFNLIDASNALGSNSATIAGRGQTSHNWGAPDTQPKAGATAPSRALYPQFYSRYGSSQGKVTCSRCHNPHGTRSNEHLLVLGAGSAQQMCLACHATWNQGHGKTNITHPVGIDYAASVSANAGKYVTSLPEDDGNLHANNQISLFGGKILCGTCHQLHFADSATTTEDIPANFDVLTMSGGDGKLLRMDGPGRADNSSLCRTCHTYQAHGESEGEQVGCMVCHGGHANDDPSLPNYYILRKNATTTTYGMVVGLDYSSPAVLDPAQKSSWWNDGIDGMAMGYCEKCHGDARTIGVGAGDYHKAAAVCTDCHSHSASTSFAANCNGCHAYPPAWGSHSAHIGSAKMSALAECKSCHATSTHLNGQSEVRFGSADSRMNGASYVDADETSRYAVASGYGSSPAYVSCDNLYCHSNAAPFDQLNAYRQPTWGGAAMTCGSCHGDSANAAGMSGNHAKHVDAATYGFACGRCHAQTVPVETGIVDPALHLNGEKDVSLAGGGSYAAGRNCTNLPCHGNGAGGPPNQEAIWGGSLDCTGCHNGRIGDTVQMETNAHHRLANSAWIRQYPCEFCHNQTVDGTGQIRPGGQHVDGGPPDVIFKLDNESPDLKIFGKDDPSYNESTKICENIYCHSDGTADNPVVKNFPWNSGVRAECDSCHGHQSDCDECHVAGSVPQWALEDQWKKATPMYVNTGPATESQRPNSHLRHLQSDFSCGNCHFNTVKVYGSCAECHESGLGTNMSETGHVDPAFHVNGHKDVAFAKRVFNSTTGKWEGVALPTAYYDPVTRKCSGTECHIGKQPVWGMTVQNTELLCLECHGTTGADREDYQEDNGIRGLINLTEWYSRGHGRRATSGNYPVSNNPAPDFEVNPCWYCHDYSVLHYEADNPLRLKLHPQFNARFEKECVYCHMEQTDDECRGCHAAAAASLAPQLAGITGVDPGDGLPYSVDHAVYALPGNTDSCLTSGCHLPQDESQCLGCHANPATPDAPQLIPGKVFVGSPDPPYSLDHASYDDGQTSCLTAGCHTNDAHIHNTGAGVWSAAMKNDIRQQYLMMGVCLQCHDDDGVVEGGAMTAENNHCTQCHQGTQYRLGFNPTPDNPASRTIAAASKVTGFHFGYKHKQALDSTGQWRGGAFCWDCHDPHGDNNIYMIQDKVSTQTDGVFGIPLDTSAVDFKAAGTGTDFARTTAPYNGLCNVCHQNTAHYAAGSGDNHQTNRPCTSCHSHSFSAGHASDQPCNECHLNKPIPRHTAFSQPRDCTQCHEGSVNKRMDIMRQFRGRSHHVQGVAVDNKNCYACHWEATEDGLINTAYHEGYNYKTHETRLDAKNDLVIWGPGERPTRYELGTTAVVFTANKIGTVEERAEVGQVSLHCLGCHSDQNNDTDVFGDCKTPRRYAWDRTSVASRYLQEGTTTWGKYTARTLAIKNNQQKAYSAHGQATLNQGGWDESQWNIISSNGFETQTNYAASGFSINGAAVNTRAGGQNVQCYDCHSSHGSYTEGTTSSYVTFDGTNNGGNLKETQLGKGGYSFNYRAQETLAATDGRPNLLAAGSSQCFDCHETADRTQGTPSTLDDFPWGYQSTFGATSPIIGYDDSLRFGGGANGIKRRFAYRNTHTGISGHFNPNHPIPNAATKVTGQIKGLCSACHDPHGVSPVMDADQSHAVPLLKGTWLTTPYPDDSPQMDTDNSRIGTESSHVYLDERVFPGSSLAETDQKFAGLCLNCHPKQSLTDGLNNNTAFKSVDRIHESVKGWGDNQKHKFTCSKCHQVHSAGLPRLMRTNCLDWDHRGRMVSGGVNPKWYSSSQRFPLGNGVLAGPCHQQSPSPSNFNQEEWNYVTPW